MCAALLCAAYLFPPQHRGLINEPLAKGAGLQLPSLWPGFCWLWSVYYSLITLTDELRIKMGKIHKLGVIFWKNMAGQKYL